MVRNAEYYEPFWVQGAVSYVKRMVREGEVYFGEELRALMECGVGEAINPKAKVGAAVKVLVTHGVLVWCGRLRPCEKESSHGHKGPVWEVTPKICWKK